MNFHNLRAKDRFHDTEDSEISAFDRRRERKMTCV
jgi:hypothetical protein